MSELMFVVKSFVIAIVVTMLMQVKVGNMTIETQAEDFLQKSSVCQYLQSVATGAVLMIHNTGKAASDFVSKKFGHNQEPQKAGRKL